MTFLFLPDVLSHKKTVSMENIIIRTSITFTEKEEIAMEKEKRTQAQMTFLIKAAYYALWAGLAYWLVKLLGTVLLPFLAAFFFAYFLNYPVAYLQKRVKLKRSLASVLVVGAFFLILAALIYGLLYSICTMAGRFFMEMGGVLTDRLLPAAESFIREYDAVLGGSILGGADFSPSGELVSKISSALTDCISGAAACLPGIGMNTLIVVIATFFIELELPQIRNFLWNNIPERWRGHCRPGKKKAVRAIGRYFGAYALIFFITFGELTAGFLLLKINNAAFLALVIAALDILPILGTGTVLLPWGAVTFICGDRTLGIGIFILYLFITVVRNFAEPRLVGRQMGLSPVVTLPAMLIGYRILGILGLFLFPMGVAVLNYLNQKDMIHLYKN